MSTLDFVPRTLKRTKVDVEKPMLTPDDLQIPAASSSKSGATTGTMPTAQKKKQQQDTKPSLDFAFLVWLSLSDYWLWADGDLRRKLDTNEGHADAPEESSAIDDEDKMAVDEQESKDISDENGYVPLDYLLKQSSAFLLVSNVQPYCDAKEITYVNSLRQFAKGVIDVRFIVDSESSATRAAVTGRRRRKPQSGYEVRRMDFASLKDSQFSRYRKSDWDGLTVYLENIPIQYAKVPGIGKLVLSLLPPFSGSSMRRVQNIVFPPHHQDPPGAIPICKGFALVTLAFEGDVQALLEAWPRESEKRASTHDPKEQKQDQMTSEKKKPHGAEEKSAMTSGLRVCTKARWEGLRAEYLLYRQQLINEINQHQDEEEARWQKKETIMGEEQSKDSKEESRTASGSKRKQLESTTPHEGGIHPESRYPIACLVFVRHVHPGTNKTTLRTLFSQAWTMESNGAIDYIDYSKNMDSCYVRFATPGHAEFFVDYFSSHRIAQLSGLDGTGLESSEVKTIIPEVVLGKREEVYWEKVPEKLRRQAVEKTLKAIHGPDTIGSSGVEHQASRPEGDGGGKRKRRRKAKTAD